MAGLRLNTPHLEFRHPSGQEPGQLAGLAAERIHEPGQTPSPCPGAVCLRRSGRPVVQQHWPRRGNWPADDGTWTSQSSKTARSSACKTSPLATTRSLARPAPSPGSACATGPGHRHRDACRGPAPGLRRNRCDRSDPGSIRRQHPIPDRLQETRATNSMASNATPSAVAPPRPAVCVCLASSGRRISASLSRSPGLRVAGHCPAWETTGGTSSQLPQRCVPFASDALSHPAQPRTGTSEAP